MSKLFNYTLKGVNGWSFCNLKTIDIRRIITASYDKRIFKFFDKEYDYLLHINYIQSNTSNTISKRYKTLSDVKKEIVGLDLQGKNKICKQTEFTDYIFK